MKPSPKSKAQLALGILAFAFLIPFVSQAEIYAKFDAIDVNVPELEDTLWGNAADADHDRIRTLLEYVLGLNPLLADAGDGPQLVPQTIDTETFYAIVFDRRPDPSVEVFVEVSSALLPNAWSSDSTEINQVSSTPVNEMQQLVFRDQRPLSTAPNRFYRLGARLQPSP